MDDIQFKNFCVKQKCDPNLAQEYYGIISKIFNDALQKDIEFNEKLVNRHYEFHRTAFPNYINWMKLYENIQQNLYLKNKDHVDLLLLTRYLITVEAIASHYVTILYYACYKAYYKNDKANHESFNTVHNNVSLGKKLKLIKKHDLEKYADSVNKTIRNSIGHMTFKINNGKIKIPTDKTEMHEYTEINIEQVGNNLDEHIDAMRAAVWRYYMRYPQNQSHLSDWPIYL